jgi:oxygen-dependent protoporphyrinogen oxidase
VTDVAESLPSLRDQVIDSNDAARRVFIAHRGELLPMPPGMVMMVPGDWSGILKSSLLSKTAKLRLIRELLEQPCERVQDVSVGQFIEEHFGRELLESITEPLLSGVYGGEVSKLSARSVLPRFVGYEEKYGSLIRGVRQERKDSFGQGSLFRSFRSGMQSLTDALAAHVSRSTEILSREVIRIARQTTGWRLYGEKESWLADWVVVAVPAHLAANLLENVNNELATQLSGIPYSSAILVTLVYDRGVLCHPLDGFGFLVPRAERKTIAAATWVSTKFPNRTPPELAAIRAFIVGEQGHSLMRTPDNETVPLVRKDLSRFMGIEAEPQFFTVHRWPLSMPQYVVGHASRVARIASLVKGLQGLFLVGNSYDGVGVPDCVRLAHKAAEKIANQAYG